MSTVIGIFAAELERSEYKEKASQSSVLATSIQNGLAIVAP